MGLVSRSGVIPISYTQDTPGPMARTVRDAAICLGVIAGIDVKDNKTKDENAVFHTDYTQFMNIQELKGKRIGWYNVSEGRNYKVDVLMQQAVSFMEKSGATVVPISSIEAPGTGEHSFQVMLFEYQDGLNRYFESLGDGSIIKNLSDLIAFNKKDALSLRFHNQK